MQDLGPPNASAATLRLDRGKTFDGALDVMSVQPGVPAIAKHVEEAQMLKASGGVSLAAAGLLSVPGDKRLQPESLPERNTRQKITAADSPEPGRIIPTPHTMFFDKDGNPAVHTPAAGAPTQASAPAGAAAVSAPALPLTASAESRCLVVRPCKPPVSDMARALIEAQAQIAASQHPQPTAPAEPAPTAESATTAAANNAAVHSAAALAPTPASDPAPAVLALPPTASSESPAVHTALTQASVPATAVLALPPTASSESPAVPSAAELAATQASAPAPAALALPLTASPASPAVHTPAPIQASAPAPAGLALPMTASPASPAVHTPAPTQASAPAPAGLALPMTASPASPGVHTPAPTQASGPAPAAIPASVCLVPCNPKPPVSEAARVLIEASQHPQPAASAEPAPTAESATTAAANNAATPDIGPASATTAPAAVTASAPALSQLIAPSPASAPLQATPPQPLVAGQAIFQQPAPAAVVPSTPAAVTAAVHPQPQQPTQHVAASAMLAAAANPAMPDTGSASRREHLLAIIGKILHEYETTGSVTDASTIDPPAAGVAGPSRVDAVPVPPAQSAGHPAMPPLPSASEPAPPLDITPELTRDGSIVPSRRMANSSTHPTEYAAYRRFCEKNPGSSMQVVRAWEWGAQPTLKATIGSGQAYVKQHC